MIFVELESSLENQWDDELRTNSYLLETASKLDPRGFFLPVVIAFHDIMETNSTKEDTTGTKENANGTKKNTNGTKEHINGTKENTNGTNENNTGNIKNGTKDNTKATNRNNNGIKENNNGTKGNTSGTKENTNGTKKNTNGTKDDINGTKENINETKDSPKKYPKHLNYSISFRYNPRHLSGFETNSTFSPTGTFSKQFDGGTSEGSEGKINRETIIK